LHLLFEFYFFFHLSIKAKPEPCYRMFTLNNLNATTAKYVCKAILLLSVHLLSFISFMFISSQNISIQITYYSSIKVIKQKDQKCQIFLFCINIFLSLFSPFITCCLYSFASYNFDVTRGHNSKFNTNCFQLKNSMNKLWKCLLSYQIKCKLKLSGIDDYNEFRNLKTILFLSLIKFKANY